MLAPLDGCGRPALVPWEASASERASAVLFGFIRFTHSCSSARFGLTGVSLESTGLVRSGGRFSRPRGETAEKSEGRVSIFAALGTSFENPMRSARAHLPLGSLAISIFRTGEGNEEVEAEKRQRKKRRRERGETIIDCWYRHSTQTGDQSAQISVIGEGRVYVCDMSVCLCRKKKKKKRRVKTD
jgi:hypothetical protein